MIYTGVGKDRQGERERGKEEGNLQTDWPLSAERREGGGSTAVISTTQDVGFGGGGGALGSSPRTHMLAQLTLSALVLKLHKL